MFQGLPVRVTGYQRTLTLNSPSLFHEHRFNVVTHPDGSTEQVRDSSCLSFNLLSHRTTQIPIPCLMFNAVEATPSATVNGVIRAVTKKDIDVLSRELLYRLVPVHPFFADDKTRLFPRPVSLLALSICLR